MWEMYTGELKDNQVYERQWNARPPIYWTEFKKMGNKGSKKNVKNIGEGEQSLSLTNLSITNILLLSSRGSS